MKKEAYRIYEMPLRKSKHNWNPKEESDKGAKNLLKEIMTENIANLGRDMDIQVHKINRLPQNFNPK